FGSMAKPFHAGLGAAHAIDAVDLAHLGMTASPDAIEHPAGFLAAVSPAGRVDRTSSRPGWVAGLRIRDLGLSIKKYPMCFATHRVIDAALDLRKAEGIDFTQVRAIRATVGPAQASMLRNHQPQTGLEAKFSLEFAAAAALIAGKVGLEQLSDDFVARPDVQTLMTKVHTDIIDSVNPHEP